MELRSIKNKKQTVIGEIRGLEIEKLKKEGNNEN